MVVSSSVDYHSMSANSEEVESDNLEFPGADRVFDFPKELLNFPSDCSISDRIFAEPIEVSVSRFVFRFAGWIFANPF